MIETYDIPTLQLPSIKLPTITDSKPSGIALVRNRLYFNRADRSENWALGDVDYRFAHFLVAHSDTPYLASEIDMQAHMPFSFKADRVRRELSRDISAHVGSHFIYFDDGKSRKYAFLTDNKDVTTVCEKGRAKLSDADIKPRSLKKRQEAYDMLESYYSDPEQFHAEKRRKKLRNAGAGALAFGVGAAAVIFIQHQNKDVS